MSDAVIPMRSVPCALADATAATIATIVMAIRFNIFMAAPFEA
jgi:hypothetical protein